MDLDFKKINNDISRRDFKHSRFVPIGSWGMQAFSNAKFYLDCLSLVFRQDSFRPEIKAPPHADAFIYFVGLREGRGMFRYALPAQEGKEAIWQYPEEGVMAIFTGNFSIALFNDKHQAKILVFIKEPIRYKGLFKEYFYILMHKILFKFGRIYTHAAAVKFNGKVNIFMGEGGGGKTSICLKLAQEGAGILSEDHVIFKKEGTDFLVSGCDRTFRVTEEIEKYFFKKPLRGKSIEVWGKKKKEFLLPDFFKNITYIDFPFHSIFFNRIGNNFKIRNISRQEAVLRLMEANRFYFRSTHANDLGDYLEYFSRLIETAEPFDLELSRNLKDLGRLAGFLKSKHV